MLNSDPEIFMQGQMDVFRDEVLAEKDAEIGN